MGASEIEELLQNVLAGQEIFIEILSTVVNCQARFLRSMARRRVRDQLSESQDIMKASGNH
jgi:hypothetical protein